MKVPETITKETPINSALTGANLVVGSETA